MTSPTTHKLGMRSTAFKRRIAHLYWPAVLQSVAVGAIGGFLGWIPGEMESSWFDNAASFESNTHVYLDVFLYFLIVSAAIGAALGALPGWQNRSLRQGTRGAVIGGLLGGACGGLFALPAQFMYGALGYGVLARAVAWAINGIGPGLCPGIVTQDRGRIARGLIGGLAGGFVAGLLFDAVWALLPHSPSDTGTSSRFVGDIAVGACIGLMVALVEVALRNAWLAVISGKRNGTQFILSKTTTSIGTDDRDDIILWGDAEVVPHHAWIQRARHQYMLYNPSPLSPTLINGCPIPASAPLHDGATIRLGETDLLFQTHAPASHRDLTTMKGNVVVPLAAVDHAASAPRNYSLAPIREGEMRQAGDDAKILPLDRLGVPVANGDPGPALKASLFRLVSVDGAAAIRVVHRTAPMTIGRSQDNDIVIADPSVSSRHATMRWDGDRWIVSDVGSANGTYVSYSGIPTDERPIQENALKGGSLIRFGNIAYRLERLPDRQ